MSILTWVKSFFSGTANEEWILNFLSKVKADVAIAVQDIDIALAWVANHADEIATISKELETLLVASGVIVITPQMQAAIDAANAAVNAINDYAAKVKAGETPADAAVAVADGYIATKQAQVALATATIAFAKMSAPKAPKKVIHK